MFCGSLPYLLQILFPYVKYAVDVLSLFMYTMSEKLFIKTQQICFDKPSLLVLFPVVQFLQRRPFSIFEYYVIYFNSVIEKQANSYYLH